MSDSRGIIINLVYKNQNDCEQTIHMLTKLNFLILDLVQNISETNLLYIHLTHYHTMPHFDALKINSCGKHCENRRNCL